MLLRRAEKMLKTLNQKSNISTLMAYTDFSDACRTPENI